MSDNWYEFLKPFCDDALANALQNDIDPDDFLQSVREVCHQRIAALSALKPFEVPNDAASHGNLDKNHSNVANNRPVKTESNMAQPDSSVRRSSRKRKSNSKVDEVDDDLLGKCENSPKKRNTMKPKSIELLIENGIEFGKDYNGLKIGKMKATNGKCAFITMKSSAEKIARTLVHDMTMIVISGKFSFNYGGCDLKMTIGSKIDVKAGGKYTLENVGSDVGVMMAAVVDN